MDTEIMREMARGLYDKAEAAQKLLTRLELAIESQIDLSIASELVDRWDTLKAEADSYVRQADALIQGADYTEYTEQS